MFHKILIVDDSPTIRFSSGNALRRTPRTISAAKQKTARLRSKKLANSIPMW